METLNRHLSKRDTAQALGVDVKTLNRWIKKGTFPGPSVIENGFSWWTMRQVERYLDDPVW